MIKHIKQISKFRQFPYRSFSKLQPPKNPIYTPPSLLQIKNQAAGKYPPDFLQKLSTLHTNIKQFIKDLPTQIETCKNSPLSYLALFARSCLIANKYLPYQSYYPAIKKIINSRQVSQLTPFSCTALAECFSYFKYEGDQGKIVKKFCDYYAENYCLFSQSQESAFWEFYMKIMANKTHHNVKFVNLQRQRQKTIQFSTAKQILTKYINPTKLNKKIIKNIQYQNTQNEIFLTMTKPSKSSNPNQKPIQIIIRIQGLINFNEYPQQKRYSEIDPNLWVHIMQECKKLNSNVSKGWNVIFHGDLEEFWGGDQQYRYSSVDQVGNQLGYLRSQKIEQVREIGQEDLSNSQKLANLRLSKRYHNAIFYNSTNPNKRLIDTIPTLMLSINPKHLKKPTLNLKYHKQNSQKSSTYLPSYLTIPQLKQIYGYSKLYQSHIDLYQKYKQVQHYLQHLYQKDKQRKFEINQVKAEIEESEENQDQVKQIIAGSSEIFAELAVNDVNSIGHVNFNGGYDQVLKDVMVNRGYFGGEIYWQFRPFFGDVMRIMDEVDKMVEDAQKQKEKHVKIKIVTSKENLPYLAKHFVEAKYWTVPKLSNKSKEQLQAKQMILSELIKKI